MHEVVKIGAADVAIGPLDRRRHGAACARMMCESEPWISLGRTYERSLAVVEDASQEAYAALSPAGEPIGLLLLMMQGALVGYVRSIVVQPAWRSRRLGEAIMSFAERRIQKVSPNVFLMVSSSNALARRFYQRLGYREIGALRQYLVAERDEVLMWKSAGPLAEWQPANLTSPTSNPEAQ